MPKKYTKKTNKKHSAKKSVTRKGYGPYKSLNIPGYLRSGAKAYNAWIPRPRFKLFPNTKIVRHKYCEDIIFPGGAAAGVPATYQLRANSMYDPNYTGVGHQPMFRDQMAAEYNYYTVLSSGVKVTFPAEDGTRRHIALWLDNETTVPTSANDMKEQHRYYSNIRLDKRNGPLKLKCSYDAAKFAKTNVKGILADNDQKVAVGSNPSTTAVKYFTLMCWPQYSGDTLGTIGVSIEMYFVTMWREPVDHTGS